MGTDEQRHAPRLPRQVVLKPLIVVRMLDVKEMSFRSIHAALNGDRMNTGSAEITRPCRQHVTTVLVIEVRSVHLDAELSSRSAILYWNTTIPGV